MTIIAKEIELVGSKGREKVTGLFDSGATYSCIKRELVEKLGVIEILPEPIEFENGKGRGKCRGERAHESNLLS